MSQHNIDPLEIHDLPSDPREMALRLLGMTRSELTEIDSKVVSGHNSVGGTRADYNKIAKEVITQIQPTAIPQSQPVPPPAILPQPVTVLPSDIITTPLIEQPLQDVKDDRDQLEFDFYKKLKPEDIEYQLRVINSKLDNLENLLQEFLSKKNKKKFSINADTAQ